MKTIEFSKDKVKLIPSQNGHVLEDKATHKTYSEVICKPSDVSRFVEVEKE